MPLRQTDYGGICPLGKFTIDLPGGGYTADPVEACLTCNFADLYTEETAIDKTCNCPDDMTWCEYDRLREDFAQKPGRKSKGFFQIYVTEKLFASYAELWKRHCDKPNIKVQSSIKSYLDCEGYKKLVKLGKVFPLEELILKKCYDEEFAFPAGWSCLLSEINHEYKVPDEIRGNIPKMNEHAIKFINDYIEDILQSASGIRFEREVIERHRVKFKGNMCQVDGGEWKPMKRARHRICIIEDE